MCLISCGFVSFRASTAFVLAIRSTSAPPEAAGPRQTYYSYLIPGCSKQSHPERLLALGEQDHCSKTPVAAAMANPEPERLTEVDIPKLPLYLAFGVIFGVAPMLPNRYNRDLVYLVSTIYKRVGPLGLLGIPFCTLAMEKTAYDTYTAYHGRSIYADAAKKNEPPPQFPSGGAQLPSFSLIETRKLVADPVVFRLPWVQSAVSALRRRETNQ